MELHWLKAPEFFCNTWNTHIQLFHNNQRHKSLFESIEKQYNIPTNVKNCNKID